MADLYYIAAYFFIYSFLGWALEVAFHVVSVGKFINRGFLNGPICPIYGCGMITVLAVFGNLSDNPLLIFAGGLIFATLIELIGGFVLFKIFHMRWWDYSAEPFNLNGYICPKFSLAWGICILFVVDIIHPFITKCVTFTDRLPGHIILIFITLVFITDTVITVLSVMKLNRDLEHLNKMGADIRKVSDELTERIGETTLETANRIQEGQIQAALARSELRDEFETFRKHAHGLIGYGRLYKAFPQMSHARYNDELNVLLDNIKFRAGEMLNDVKTKAK